MTAVLIGCMVAAITGTASAAQRAQSASAIGNYTSPVYSNPHN